jgi:hypothetical protein
MGSTMAKGTNKVLSDKDKDSVMSDTAYYSGQLREAFPSRRYGGSKASIWAAFRYISPKVNKQFTERRARAIWEGAARRIDAEEAAIIQKAKIEEARREYRELHERLSALDASLAAIDQEFHGPAREAIRAQMLGSGDLRTR